MLVIICRGLEIHIHIAGRQRSWGNWNRMTERGLFGGKAPAEQDSTALREDTELRSAERARLPGSALQGRGAPVCQAPISKDGALLSARTRRLGCAGPPALYEIHPPGQSRYPGDYGASQAFAEDFRGSKGNRFF